MTLAHTTTPAMARPGTPKNLELFDCSDPFPPADKLRTIYYEPSRSLYDNPPPPALCVSFINTAPEPVVFEFELTSWGQLLNHNGLGTTCIGTRFRCTAANNFVGLFNAFAQYDKNDLEWDHEGLKLAHVDYSRQYCMRVRTRAVPSVPAQNLGWNDQLNEQEVSLKWTDWVCIVTPNPPVPPPLPPKPTAPVVTVTTTKHGDKVNVSWEPAQNVGYYTVQGKMTCRGVDMVLVPSNLPDKLPQDMRAFTLDVSWADAMDMANNGYVYRVCNHNDAGVACSQWATNVLDPPCFREAALRAKIEAAPGENNVTTRVKVQTPPATKPLDVKSEIEANMAAKIGRLPDAQPYAQWMTGDFDSDFGRLSLTPQAGTYAYHDGRVSVSSRQGPNMDGTWQESSGAHKCLDGLYRGRFHFEFTDSGFTGQFGYCDDPVNAGKWNGKRHEEVIH
jgi:hypothetical protein